MHGTSALIILLGWAASQLPADPPRGLRWSRGTEVRYGVVGAVPANLDLPRFAAAVDAAFTTWERPCSTLTFDRLPAPRDLTTPAVDGQNTIRFELNAIPPEVDPAHVIAFTSVIGALCNGTLTEVDVTFNAVGFTWSDALDAPNDRDIETIMLHEGGHLLGLDHTPDMSAIMFAQNVERVRRGLAQDDLDGVCSLYAADRDGPCVRDADCAHGQVCGLYPGSDLANVSARCSDPVGVSGPGEACRPVPDACGNGCANNLCANTGVCSALCAADADCPAGDICFPAAFDFGVFPMSARPSCCVTRPVATCPDGQTCVAFPHPVDPASCGPAATRPAMSPDGAACANGDACAGGMCRNGRCTHVCDSDADCGFPRECHVVVRRSARA
jgi:Cys-rich repeat protein